MVAWWYTVLIPALRMNLCEFNMVYIARSSPARDTALGRQGQADLSEFEDSLVYEARSRTARTYTEKPCLQKPKKEKRKEGRNKRKHGRFCSVF